MTRQLIVTAHARAEIAEASDRYDAQSQQVGSEFLRAVDSALEVITKNPLQYQVIERKGRRAPIGKFPYGLFYSVSPNEITVVACLHGRRHPGHWRSRL
jgi:plasmid stabilization system protein ParE